MSMMRIAIRAVTATKELARARSLRLRLVHRPMATPVEVRSLSELRWRRFSRVRVTVIR